MDSNEQHFSLRKIYKAEDSLFQVVHAKSESISGIVIPWAYVACKFSSFCWHTEDLFLYSLNYMHEGGCKIWYTIPYEDVEKAREIMLRKYRDEIKKRPTILDDVLINFSPLIFIKEGVKVYKIYQEEGDMVLTFPGVYHGGFSPTYNICEAVNMAGVDWIEAARKHIEMNSREGYPRKSCFSLEWMIFENMLQVDRLNFSDSTKSKLKAQYKNMVDIELSKRKKIRQTVEEELLFQGGKLKYYELQCNACRTYCYLSCVACRSCYMTACLNCNLGCTCNSKSKVLFVRHTENELVNY